MFSKVSRLLALPLVTAGILGGALVGTSPVASADTDDDDTYSAFDDNSYFEEDTAYGEDFDGDFSGVDEYYSAFDDDYDYAPANEIVASPDTYADPAPNLIPWGQWITGGAASAPQVDNTVQQSR